MARFSKLYVQMDDTNPLVYVAAFKRGLGAGSLNSDLTRRPAQDMLEFRVRVQEFIMV